ncbi:MAG TPA: hypothetical protein VG847_01195 [Chitinophagaceae bacterium]|nr:hypothetical protein [Chitinophagaceae bacterium]
MFKIAALKNNTDSLIAAAAGFGIIFLFTRHNGIGLCPDGVVYTTTAKNIATTCRIIDFRNYPMVEFPVFYPVFLSAIILVTGLQPLAFGAILNGLLFAIIIYIAGYITSRFSNATRWYKAAMLSCIVLSPGILEVYSMMWSETVFILWILLFIICIHSYLKNHKSTSLITSAVIVSLACITRYAGVTLAATGFFLIILDKRIQLKQKIRNVIIFSIISPVLLIANLTRNYIVGGSLTGIRESSLTDFQKNLHDVGAVFYDWLPFFNQHYNYAAVLASGIIVFLTFLCIKEFLIKKDITRFQNVPLLFAWIYLLFMIVIATVSRFETLDSRFISPAFIPLLWSCSNWLMTSERGKQNSKKGLMIAMGLIIFILFQYGQLSADYESWDGIKDAGIPGYTEDQWQYSRTVLYMEKDSLPFLKDHTIYSDAYDAVYFFTGRPGKFLPNYENKTAVKAFLNDKKCYVIWFDDGENDDLVGKNFIEKIKKMKLVKQFDDGCIYEQDE